MINVGTIFFVVVFVGFLLACVCFCFCPCFPSSRLFAFNVEPIWRLMLYGQKYSGFILLCEQLLVPSGTQRVRVGVWGVKNVYAQSNPDELSTTRSSETNVKNAGLKSVPAWNHQHLDYLATLPPVCIHKYPLKLHTAMMLTRFIIPWIPRGTRRRSSDRPCSTMWVRRLHKSARRIMYNIRAILVVVSEPGVLGVIFVTRGVRNRTSVRELRQQLIAHLVQYVPSYCYTVAPEY